MKPRKQIETTEAIGYIRVSTAEQADSGLSLEAQKTKIEAQCIANGWKLLRICEDAGLSAKTLDRPGLQQALKMLKPGRVLLAYKLDRITRRVPDLYELTEIIEKAGGDWGSVMEKFDTTNANGRMMLGIWVQMSQWERETISERTVIALGVKRARGERLGTTPLGYTTVENEDGSHSIQEDQEEQHTVQMARELRGKGLSLRQIAAALHLAGCRTKRGGKWEAATISKILKHRYVEAAALTPAREPGA